jgi:hypothetical protein
MYSKTFYDLACGGSKEAKAQAIAWRDEQLPFRLARAAQFPALFR